MIFHTIVHCYMLTVNCSTGSGNSRGYLILFMLACLYGLGVIMTSLNIWKLRRAVANYFGISREKCCERDDFLCCLKTVFICCDLCALCQIATELDYRAEIRRNNQSSQSDQESSSPLYFNIPMKGTFSPNAMPRR